VWNFDDYVVKFYVQCQAIVCIFSRQPDLDQWQLLSDAVKGAPGTQVVIGEARVQTIGLICLLVPVTLYTTLDFENETFSALL